MQELLCCGKDGEGVELRDGMGPKSLLLSMKGGRVRVPVTLI